ncbi:hypothetical protein KP509_08G005500 [Ceratopteris richardii]|uniref:Glycine-rich protein n=1 Tax=Ceratopteris richardii TaxID=49495 RepID=A0A8T2U9M0_CERRI|nr:hypothetical protein KP509_08G005500 [Ceratopteris richardii]
MAGNEAVAATPIKEGPVLTMMNKRLRALKKKYNKILQIEESKVQGKAINKEQEEVLKAKISVAVLIDEYERLRQPLQTAVKEEIAEREKELLTVSLSRGSEGEEKVTSNEKDADSNQVGQQKTVENNGKEGEVPESAVCCSDEVSLNRANESDRALEVENAHDTSSHLQLQYSGSNAVDKNIADLLTFLYFSQLFDVRSHGEASSSVLWTKAHERSSCLSYDCVTEDEASPLLESDLDELSYFGSLFISRPPNATYSHKDALQHCVEHAKRWLQNSDSPIRDDFLLTYSHLRERLNRILSSEYFTMIPELQTVTQQTAAVAASATAQYAPHLLVQKADDLPMSDSTGGFIPQERESQFAMGEQYSQEHANINSSSDSQEIHSQSNPSETSREIVPKVELCASSGEGKLSGSNGVQQDEVTNKADDSSQYDSVKGEGQQQQQSHVPNVTVGPRGQQGFRGGGRGNNYGGRGRGYANGRGGRSGAGRFGYGNGWGGQYYDQGGYYARGYNGRGGRGSRGGNSAFNGYINNGQGPRGTIHSAA